MEAETPEEFLLLPTWPLAFTADLSHETPAAARVVSQALQDTYRVPAPVEPDGPSTREEEEEQAVFSSSLWQPEHS